MPKQVMRRQAADNEYLHKDFHGALSGGIEYLHNRYGEGAVREYLRQFAAAYHAPLKQAIRDRGLGALRDHYEAVYRREGGAVRFCGDGDELVVEVEASPAVMHMREHGYPVARLFHETVKTVAETLCDGTGFVAELVEYDPQTGRSVQRFRRQAAAGAA